MAADQRFVNELRRSRRWLHTTLLAREATELGVAIALGAVVLALISVVSEIGILAVVLAALPLANQVRHQVNRTRRHREDERTLGAMPGDDTDLAGADLSGSDLAGSSLRLRDLSDARLTSANLVGADLTGATMSGARLRGADLSFGSLAGADCRKTNLSRARLIEADLDGIDARGANLERSDLRHASLVGSNLLGARFGGADVRGADLTGAKLAADALADAVLDRTTILTDGSPARSPKQSDLARWRSAFGLVISGTSLGIIRPALHGLAVVGMVSGGVAAVESSGEGLGDELAIITRSDALPVSETGLADRRTFPARRSTAQTREEAGGLAFGRDAAVSGVGAEREASTGGAGPGSAANDGDPGSSPIGGLPDPNPVDPGVAPDDVGSGLVERTPPASGLSGRDDPDDSVNAASVDGEEPTTTTVPEPQPPDTDDTPDGTGGLTEFSPPATATQAVLRQVRIVVSSTGGPSTVTSASSLGQLEPRTVDGQQGWDLGLAAGEVRVQVVPGDDAVASACQILVDGTERSFQSSLPGQVSICLIDLGAGA